MLNDSKIGQLNSERPLHQTAVNSSLLWLSYWGSKYKVRTFDVYWTCRNLHAFWEDQMDPKLRQEDQNRYQGPGQLRPL